MLKIPTRKLHFTLKKRKNQGLPLRERPYRPLPMVCSSRREDYVHSDRYPEALSQHKSRNIVGMFGTRGCRHALDQRHQDAALRHEVVAHNGNNYEFELTRGVREGCPSLLVPYNIYDTVANLMMEKALEGIAKLVKFTSIRSTANDHRILLDCQTTRMLAATCVMMNYWRTTWMKCFRVSRDAQVVSVPRQRI